MSWFADAGFPNAGRDAVLCLWSCVSVAKKHYEWKRKNGEIHPDLIVNFNEANAAAEGLKAIRRRLRTLERGHRQDGEPLPAPLTRIRDVIEDEDVQFYLSPINPDFIGRDFWWRNQLAFLRDGVIHALRLAGRNPNHEDGNEAGPVSLILAQALEYIDGTRVEPVNVHSRLKQLKRKKKRRHA